MAVTLFISDIHLDESRPTITNTFLEFLTFQASQADAVYILGDLFDAWIGDDAATLFHQKIIQAFRTLTQHGTPIYMMVGNRDFLIGQQFAQASGCQLLPDPTVIDLYGRPTLLMHGDTLCTRDVRYLKFRQYVRNPFLKTCFLKFPLFCRQAIARFLRGQSKRYTTQTKAIYMDVTPEEIPRVMNQYNVSQLIHGHTHRPTIHYLDDFSRHIVLGDWDKTGHALMYDATGEAKLIKF